MSSVVIAGNTSGSVTLSAPDVAGTTTLTLPSTSGNVLTSASSLAASQLPTGSVLQVLSTSKTDTYITTSGTFGAITGLSVTITPSSTSNKILVMSQVTTGSYANTNGGGALRLYRNGSDVTGASGDASGSRITGWAQTGVPYSSGWMVLSRNLTYLDSPSSTSALTYAIYARSENANGTRINYAFEDDNNTDRVRLSSTITVMEIKG